MSNCKKCNITRRILMLIFISCVFGLIFVMTGCTTITVSGDSNEVSVTKQHTISPTVNPSALGF